MSKGLTKDEMATKLSKTPKSIGSLLRRLFGTEDLNKLKKII